MKNWIRNGIVLMLMLAASGMAVALRPTHRLAEQVQAPDLKAMIPSAFDEWREERQPSAQIVDPQQQADIEKIYTTTLSRTYVNPNGDRIMLSIAYGEDQSRDLQIHRPEVCYSSQGFQIISTEKRLINSAIGNIPAMQIIAKQGGRDEPVTYWVRFGDKIVRGNLEQGIARLTYGLTGRIADGVLFRVSNISRTPGTAFQLQESFIEKLLTASPEATRSFLLGGVAS